MFLFHNLLPATKRAVSDHANILTVTFYHSYPDEFESTRIIGERQFKKAVDLFKTASEQIKGRIDFRHAYVDFSKLEVTIPKEGGGSKVVKTCPAAMGFAFAAGTTDGPGAFDFKQGDDKVIENSKFFLYY